MCRPPPPFPPRSAAGRSIRGAGHFPPGRGWTPTSSSGTDPSHKGFTRMAGVAPEVVQRAAKRKTPAGFRAGGAALAPAGGGLDAAFRGHFTSGRMPFTLGLQKSFSASGRGGELQPRRGGRDPPPMATALTPRRRVFVTVQHSYYPARNEVAELVEAVAALDDYRGRRPSSCRTWGSIIWSARTFPFPGWNCTPSTQLGGPQPGRGRGAAAARLSAPRRPGPRIDV